MGLFSDHLCGQYFLTQFLAIKLISTCELYLVLNKQMKRLLVVNKCFLRKPVQQHQLLAERVGGGEETMYTKIVTTPCVIAGQVSAKKQLYTTLLI